MRQYLLPFRVGVHSFGHLVSAFLHTCRALLLRDLSRRSAGVFILLHAFQAPFAPRHESAILRSTDNRPLAIFCPLGTLSATPSGSCTQAVHRKSAKILTLTRGARSWMPIGKPSRENARPPGRLFCGLAASRATRPDVGFASKSSCGMKCSESTGLHDAPRKGENMTSTTESTNPAAAILAYLDALATARKNWSLQIERTQGRPESMLYWVAILTTETRRLAAAAIH